VQPGTVGNIEAGQRKQPRNLVEIAAVLGVSPLWLKSGKGPKHPSNAGDMPPQAQDVSQARNTMATQRVTWEQLMGADLSRPFELVVTDDALAPDIYRGCIARLDPARQPQAGRPVLVRDAEGRHYRRDYQVGAAGRWQAVARQRGFAPLDSEADGLVVVATMQGVDWP
jgi:hypothetical protein